MNKFDPKDTHIVSNEEILSNYKQYIQSKEVFVYLPNANLQGFVEKLSPDYLILTKTENGEVVKMSNSNESIKTLISNSHIIDISPVVKFSKR